MVSRCNYVYTSLPHDEKISKPLYPTCPTNLFTILHDFKDLLIESYKTAKVGYNSVYLNSNKVVRLPLRPIPINMRDKLDQQVEDLLKRGIIRYSSSLYSSLAVLAPKKNGLIRTCVDYRGLNKITKRDAYPLSLTSDVQNKLTGFRMFSKIDLKNGYWQIPMKNGDIEKRAFRLNHEPGLVEFTVMPFGLTDARELSKE